MTATQPNPTPQPRGDNPQEKVLRGRGTHRNGQRGALTLAVVVAAIMSLLLSGCSPNTESDAEDPAPASSGAPEELREFYEQSLNWEKCEDNFDCAKLNVPVDYAEPSAGTIDIQVIRQRATGDDRIGSLLINPGGPGGSGYDMLVDNASVMLRPLGERYDLVGFDPRGVDRSAGIECVSDKERDELRASRVDPDTDAGYEEAVAEAKRIGGACKENSGPVLGKMDTVSAAKDMDILRSAVGDETLHYLGFSYGTFLGAHYAELFPERAGRLVLDGAVDPSLSNEEVTLQQGEAFEKALRSWAEACAAGDDCPFSSADAGVKQVRELIASTDETPMRASDGREVTVGMLVSGIILPLYDRRAWSLLDAAVEKALTGDPNELLRFADLGASRDEDGKYTTNSTFAFPGVNCLDYPTRTGKDEQRADAAQLEETSPTFGKYIAYGGITCGNWPFPATGEPHTIAAEGSPPILVIGTSGDPATPVQWSHALADQLENGHLVTLEGEGHTAYPQGNKCIVDTVKDFLFEGTVPEEDPRCS